VPELTPPAFDRERFAAELEACAAAMRDESRDPSSVVQACIVNLHVAANHARGGCDERAFVQARERASRPKPQLTRGGKGAT